MECVQKLLDSYGKGGKASFVPVTGRDVKMPPRRPTGRETNAVRNYQIAAAKRRFEV